MYTEHAHPEINGGGLKLSQISTLFHIGTHNSVIGPINTGAKKNRCVPYEGFKVIFVN